MGAERNDRNETDEHATDAQNFKPDAKVSKVDPDLNDSDSVSARAEPLGRRYRNLGKKRESAAKRDKEYDQHIRSLEGRLASLEEYLGLSEGKPMLVTAPSPPEPLKIVILPKMEYKTWEKFMRNDVVRPMIEILMGEPEYDDLGKAERRLEVRMKEGLNRMPMNKSWTPVRMLDPIDGNGSQNEVASLRGNTLPEMIRFNSYSTLHVLKKKLIARGFLRSEAVHSLMLRPFKALLKHEDSIKGTMAHLLHSLKEMIEIRGSQVDDVEKEIKPSNNEQCKLALPNTEEAREAGEISSEKAKDGDEAKKDIITFYGWKNVLEDLGVEHFSTDTDYRALMSEWPTIAAVQESFDCLQDLIDNYLKPVSAMFRARKQDMASFNELWHIFQTGDIVLSEPDLQDGHMPSMQAFRVLRTSGGRRVISGNTTPVSLDATPIPKETRVTPMGGVNPFCIHAYYLDHDGVRLTPVRRRFIIAPYFGKCKIADLDIYPIEYASNAKNIQETLAARGKKFVELAMSPIPLYRACVGLELRTREELNDKIIVNMKEYFKRYPIDTPKFAELEGLDTSETSDCPLKECSNLYNGECHHRRFAIISDQHIDQTAYQKFRKDRPEFQPIVATSGSDRGIVPNYTICHNRVFAYKLRSREWIEIDVDSIEASNEVDHELGFNLLVLPADHKRILESQIREHFRKRSVHSMTSNAEDDMDLVRGKGQGLIILLHGAPGVGKTCTVECIADLMEKPLYPITCGDLGSTADDVEQGLKKHFALASRWDCVMLLDEADVFLARRTQEDLHRNSIVSVFLRMLEYYKGLLFLTTNRVGSFDEAFKSRVHISLFYPNFDRRTTIKVWKTFLKQTKRALKGSHKRQFSIDKDGILDFATQHFDDGENAQWNGRQIRNAFHTAVAMAEFEARKAQGLNYNEGRDVKISIGPHQFEKIAKTAREFDEYMAQTSGGTYDDQAAHENLRASPKELKEGAKGRAKKTNESKKSRKEFRDEDEDSDSEEAPRTKSSKKTAKQSGKKPKKETKGRSSEEDSSEASEEEARTEKARRKSVVRRPVSLDNSEEQTEDSD